MPVAVGSILKDTIEIEEELGRGAMGVVYRAKHLALDSAVAVKVLAARVADDPHARARFAREAKVIAKVDSPHVVRVSDYGLTDEGEPYIVMEFLRGEDLGSRIAESGRLGVEATAAIVRQVCTALARAREVGVIHRDIKPANVFILRQPGPLFVKVLDFGVAKLRAPLELDLTASTALVGTPYYMSPEQLIEPSRVDHRADLWSVAVIAYVCLTGKLPFEGETVGALSLAVHRGVFSPPSELDDRLPPALDSWFHRVFDPELERRFQTADDVARTFEAAAIRGRQPHVHAETVDAADPRPSTAKAVKPGDESVGGVGGPIRAPRPIRGAAVLVGAAAALAAIVVYRVALPPTTQTTETNATPAASTPIAESRVPPAATTVVTAAPASARASDHATIETEPSAQRVEVPVRSSPAPKRSAATTVASSSTPPSAEPPPTTTPKPVDVDGVPIVR